MTWKFYADPDFPQAAYGTHEGDWDHRFTCLDTQTVAARLVGLETMSEKATLQAGRVKTAIEPDWDDGEVLSAKTTFSTSAPLAKAISKFGLTVSFSDGETVQIAPGSQFKQLLDACKYAASPQAEN